MTQPQNNELPTIVERTGNEAPESPVRIQLERQATERGRDHEVAPNRIAFAQDHKSAHTSGLDLNKTDTTTSMDSKASRRSSLAAFAERLRSRSRSRSRSHSRTRADLDDDEYLYSRRRSSEIKGPYADVARAQAEYMDKLREEQAAKGITVNADGLPIPPPPERPRRASVTQILGLEKPPLSF
ncbi:hypothetical protein BGW42_002792 [Actinomortierella wolfii]|nr:hypothetical protein BGW42_002792 [Actinomortierella wolfii]KAG0237441.1 hypothetical protein BGW41_008383 [Actinomortierella wolfii]